MAKQWMTWSANKLFIPVPSLLISPNFGRIRASGVEGLCLLFAIPVSNSVQVVAVAGLTLKSNGIRLDEEPPLAHFQKTALEGDVLAR